MATLENTPPVCNTVTNTNIVFDAVKVSNCFRECLVDTDVHLEKYMEAYTELCRFLEALGKVFSFVISDVQSKLDILQHHREKSEDRKHYGTVINMVNFEVEQEKTVVTGWPPSGCRTALRLHRALEFIFRFLEDVLKASPEDKVSDIAYKAYVETIYKWHKWIVQKAVGMAMYTLPSREQMIQMVESRELLENMIQDGWLVYHAVQVVFEKNNLLELP